MQFMDMAALTCPVRITGELYISSGLLNKVLSIIMAKKVALTNDFKIGGALFCLQLDFLIVHSFCCLGIKCGADPIFEFLCTIGR